MASLLDKKMARRQQMMLDAARELFKKKGQKTTMEEIAEVAGFGVATVYNYFQTKEGIFSMMIREDMNRMKKDGEQILAEDHGEDTVESVMKLLMVYTEIYDEIPSVLMLEYLTRAKKGGVLHETIDWLIDWETNQISTLLANRKELGILKPSLDCQLAARVIINLFVHRNQHHYVGLPGGPGGVEELKEAVTFVIEPWAV